MNGVSAFIRDPKSSLALSTHEGTEEDAVFEQGRGPSPDADYAGA